MLAKIGAHARVCLSEAEAARLRAALSPELRARDEWLQIARRWRMLAQSYELAERVSGFLEWSARRLKPPEDYHGK
jgi:hypothetical protein